MATNSVNKSTVYLEGLNEVRGIAALWVLFSHIDQFHLTLKIPEVGIHDTGIAGYAVTTFFVLSGFLITYLLCHEMQKHESIDIKKFYIRRVLRIWPPYYLTIFISILLMAIGVFSFPGINKFLSGLGMFIFMLPNVGRVFSLLLPATTPLWSIGVEEQFYLVWPHLFSKLKGLKPLIWIGLFMFLLILVRVVLYVVDPSGGLYLLVKISQFQNLLLGSLAAILFFNNNKKFLNLIFHPIAQMLSLIIIIIPFVVDTNLFGDLYIEVFALGSMIFILNTSLNQKSFIKLRLKILDFVGKLSYGIYVYHFLIIYLVSKLIFLDNVFVSYLSVLVLTGGFSYLSHKYMEKPILKNRTKFSVL